MAHEVRFGQRDATNILAKRMAVRIPEIGALVGGAFGEVYRYLGARAIATAGPPFVIYHGMPEGDKPFEVEVCAPVAGPTIAPDGWATAELPAGSFVTCLHVGSYDTVGETYGEIQAWIASHGMAIGGPPREVYLSEPGTPPSQTRTIVEFPVLAVGSPAAAPAG